MSDLSLTPSPPPPPPSSSPQPLPWERSGAGLADLWATLTLIWSRPSDAFARMTVTSALGRALLFGLVVYVVSNALGQLWTLAFNNVLQGLMERFGGDALGELQQHQLSPMMAYLVSVVLSPFLFLIGILISASIVHLFLLLFGGAPGGFTTTLRVNAYGAAATVAMLIPFLGGLIVSVWWIVLMILGLKAAHRIPTGRSVAAVLVPLALCCVCVVVLVATFAATLMAVLGGAK